MDSNEALAVLKNILVNSPMGLQALQVIEEDINAVADAVHQSGFDSYTS